ncbi:MAG: 8-oxo-dGTP diphosphatase [Halodesulfurarchaeum sp.]
MQEATLCFPVEDGAVLLIEKKRGLGAGKLNGPGGKLEGGETPAEAARREVREEIRTGVPEVTKLGELAFEMGGEPLMFVHVFRAPGVDGEPAETPEAKPVWYPIDAVPYDEMWPDDRYWLPHVFAGERFAGSFVFGDSEDDLLEWELDVGVSFGEG